MCYLARPRRHNDHCYSFWIGSSYLLPSGGTVNFRSVPAALSESQLHHCDVNLQRNGPQKMPVLRLTPSFPNQMAPGFITMYSYVAAAVLQSIPLIEPLLCRAHKTLLPSYPLSVKRNSAIYAYKIHHSTFTTESVEEKFVQLFMKVT